MEDKKYVSKKELWMYALGAGGQGMIYAMMSSYISDYYVNILQLPLIFVLLLMLLARVWDAINDPLMGMIVDHKTTRWGKMKPYILFASVPIAVLTILMYSSPNISSVTGAMIFAAVVYVAWGMSYTMAARLGYFLHQNHQQYRLRPARNILPRSGLHSPQNHQYDGSPRI